MLNISLIRDNPEKVKKAMRDRGKNMDSEIDKILVTDKKRRDMIVKVEAMKAEQNAKSKQIPQMKKLGGDVAEILAYMKNLSNEITSMTALLNDVEQELKELLMTVPNVPHESVPVGMSDKDNQEVRKYSSPREFEFEPKPHWDIGKNLDILDQERAAKVSGARFTFYKGLGARLERSIINFFLDIHTKNGYKEIFPPYMVNRASMIGTGQLPKFEDDAFKVFGTDYFMIPTAEVPVTNLYRDEILNSDDLPIKYCAYSACFRSEVGSAGRDTRGIIRQHQFNKVELVKFSKDYNSYDELEELTEDAERVLKLLKLPYRVVSLCTGDLGFTSAKTYDIEVWMPSYDRYLEISSCSNFEDFQARRAGIRYKENIKDKSKLVHTLNGSGVAIGRTVAAILENYQNADGSVSIPEVLIPYMGCEIINRE